MLYRGFRGKRRYERLCGRRGRGLVGFGSSMGYRFGRVGVLWVRFGSRLVLSLSKEMMMGEGIGVRIFFRLKRKNVIE